MCDSKQHEIKIGNLLRRPMVTAGEIFSCCLNKWLSNSSKSGPIFCKSPITVGMTLFDEGVYSTFKRLSFKFPRCSEYFAFWPHLLPVFAGCMPHALPRSPPPSQALSPPRALQLLPLQSRAASALHFTIFPSSTLSIAAFTERRRFSCDLCL